MPWWIKIYSRAEGSVPKARSRQKVSADFESAGVLGSYSLARSLARRVEDSPGSVHDDEALGSVGGLEDAITHEHAVRRVYAYTHAYIHRYAQYTRTQHIYV